MSCLLVTITRHYTPRQCMHLLVTQLPAFADTAAACPPLSGHTDPRTAAASDSKNSRRDNPGINFQELAKLF